MEFRILGPLEVWDHGRPVALSGKPRALLAILLIHANRVVSSDRLIHLLWGETESDTVANTLQACVSKLRKSLEPHHEQGAHHKLVVGQPPGYLIDIDKEQLDVTRFETLSDQARQAMAAGHFETAVHCFREALGLWRGPAFADLANEPFIMPEANRLKEKWLNALEDRIDAELALARHADLVGELEGLVLEHPVRERFSRQLMLALYRSGRQAEASEIFYRTRQVLIDQAGVEPGPELQRLLKAILKQDASLDLERPPVTSSARRKDNLPLPLTSFVGRSEDIAHARELVQNGRMVTLTGAGGIGKTRLAIEVGRTLATDYSDGVALVELAPLMDPELVPQSIGVILGVADAGGRSLTEALTDYLRSRRVLLVLDNCEHLIDSCARLAKVLLEACPELHIMATSREALGIDGETAWRVPSLSLPHSERPVPTEQLTTYGAVALFADRARVAGGSFALSDTNRELVVDLCRRLDGIPLAIELAAARLTVLSLEQIAARLSDRFRLLREGSRTGSPRQRTLRATVDWSYELLPEPERALLRRLSVFAGGFSLEAAEPVCSGGSVDETEVLDLLSGLVRKSLMAVQDRGGVARYSLLETIRQYGWEKLSDAGEGQMVRDRHCRWFLQLAEQAEAEFRGRNQSAAFARLELEHDNLRAALAWSTDQPDADPTLRLTSAMGHFWRQHGYYSEGLAWLKRALELPAGANTLRGRALLWASALALELADYSAAERYGTESVAAPREGDGQWELGFAQHILGSIAIRMDDIEQAAQFLRSSFTAFQQAGTTWGLALGYHSLGLLSWATGDYELALENADEALRLFRASGDDEQVAASLRLLGSVHLTMGNFETASAVLQECLALFERLGAKRSVAHANNDLGVLARIRGDLEQAKSFHTASLQGFRQLNVHQGVGYALVELALLALTEKDVASALSTIDESLIIFRDVKDRAGIVKCLECRAAIEFQEPYRAAMLLGAAEALRESIQNPIEPYLRGWRDSIVATAVQALGAKEYAAAFSEGMSRSLDEIVRFCLEGRWPQLGSTRSREEPKPLIASHPRNNSGR